MGISQIPDQIKRAPAEALRAVFSGIGRILLAADRPGPATVQTQPHAGIAPEASPPQTARQPRREPGRATEQSRWRSLDQTGNVRLLPAGEVYDDDPTGPTVSFAASDTVPASSSPAPAPAPALPLADYDNLSLASIRARLRTLSPAQLRVLADYEQANAERMDVLGMLERRIEKLEQSQ